MFAAGRHLVECASLVGLGKPVLTHGDQEKRDEYTDEGIACLQEAVGRYRKAGGPRQPGYKFCLVWLARGFRNRQRFREAEDLLEGSLRFFRNDLTNEHEEVAFALAFLAQVRLDQRKYAGVERLLLESRAILGRLPVEKRQALGPRLPAERKAVLDRLTELYFATGQLAKAAAVARDRRRDWPNDPDQLLLAGRHLILCVPPECPGQPTLTAAEQAERKAYLEEGIASCQGAERLCRQAGGARHPLYKFSLVWLALGLRHKQDHPSAEKLLAEALPLYRRDFGPRHEEVAAVLAYLSATRVALKRHNGVEGDLKEALEICESAPGGPRPSLTVTLAAAGELYRSTKRPVQAAEAAQRRRRHWPNDPGQLYEAACELALCVPLVGQGKVELTLPERTERRKYTREALAALERSVACGFLGSGRLKDDPKLEAVRGQMAFQEIIKRAEKNGRDLLLRSATTLGFLGPALGKGPWLGATVFWLRGPTPAQK
ncbi:MAG TPA: tetratricopeptide repeat protein [Gemmataceae bacterium]|nr:tetratricopeptide repeat protein [Gemmataceae bacterium]